MEKCLTMRAGQTPVQKYWHKLLAMIQVSTVGGLPCASRQAGRQQLRRNASSPMALLSMHHIGYCVPPPPSLPAPAPLPLQEGTLDPSFVITHRPPLEQAAEAYKMFNDKADGCVKVGVPSGLAGGRRVLRRALRGPRMAGGGLGASFGVFVLRSTASGSILCFE
jgi:hypothetical protein